MEQEPSRENKEEKTFWPDKEKFFQEKDEYVKKELGETKENLKQIGFVEGESLDIVSEMTLRAEFIQKYLQENSPVECKIPVDVNFNLAFPDNIGGITVPHFSYFGKEVNEREEIQKILDANDVNNLTINKIDIVLNLLRIKNKIDDFLLFMKSSNDHGKKFWQGQLDELAIHFERTAIEETAHSFYWQSVIKNPEKFKKAVEELVKYDYEKVGVDPSAYEDTDIEKRASLWYRSYLKKYYPESQTLKEEQEKRAEQKERMEKANEENEK